MDHLSFSDIKNFGARNTLTILFTITFLLTFSSYPSWANHQDFYTATSPQNFSFPQTNPKPSFLIKLNDRLTSEIENKFIDHFNKYQYGPRGPYFKHNKNRILKNNFNQERNSRAQAALKEAFSETINNIRWVGKFKSYMKRLTTTQVRISKDFPFKGSPKSPTSLNQGLEEDSYYVGNISLSDFPFIGVKLHTSSPLFNTSLNYIPLNHLPFSVKMERNFIHNSKIGFNFNWSNQENNVYTSLLFNF